jgi:hypothetical protein
MLHCKKVIRLPKPLLKGSELNKDKPAPPIRTFVFRPIEGSGRIKLEFAKGNAAEKTWNQLVEEHHYLGHQVVVGRCLKYLVKLDDKLVGAISFSSASWRLQTRDQLLGNLGWDQAEIRDRVINNSRFLILPTVKIPNLASGVLSIATRQVRQDWELYYGVRPYVVETFVQPSRFKGTCYQASNWIQVGITKGFAKRGATYRNSQEPKALFLHGLEPRIRTRLNRVIVEWKKAKKVVPATEH